LIKRENPRLYYAILKGTEEKIKGTTKAAEYDPKTNVIRGTDLADAGEVAHELTHAAYRKQNPWISKAVDEPVAFGVGDDTEGKRQKFAELKKLMERSYKNPHPNIAAANYMLFYEVAKRFGPKYAIMLAKKMGQLGAIRKMLKR
jgi:hypothetical protein